MDNVINKVENDIWVRPWNEEKFDDLYNRDERFFSVLVKGFISWMNRNIVLYNKPINHFIFNTGSSIMYVESNGYEFSWNETTGEDTMYMQLPRCILNINSISIPQEELTSPFSRGIYERKSGNVIRGYNAEIRRLPIELTVNLVYYLSNFNESLILLQELCDKIIFQQYFNITYLGQIIRCSIEFPGDTNIEVNKIDMSSPDPNQKNITLDLKINTNYPIINERSAIPTDHVIENIGIEYSLEHNDYSTDIEKLNTILNTTDGYEEFLNNLNGEYSVDIFDNDENEYDFDKDGKVGISDIETALENIKYDKDGNNNTIDFNDLINIILLIKRDNPEYSYEYDKITNKIYITTTEGDINEIDLKKYKINHV